MLDEHHHTLHPSKGNPKSIRYQKTLSKIILNFQLPQNWYGQESTNLMQNASSQNNNIIIYLFIYLFIYSSLIV